MIFLGPKKITRFTVLLMQETRVISHAARTSKWKSYVVKKLRKETHTSWIEMKRSLGLKSDDMLACQTTVSNRRNSTEANDVI